MAKRSRTDLIEDSIITLHFAYPATPEEAQALNALKEAGEKKYLKTVERSKMLAEWYTKAKNYDKQIKEAKRFSEIMFGGENEFSKKFEKYFNQEEDGMFFEILKGED